MWVSLELVHHIGTFNHPLILNGFMVVLSFKKIKTKGFAQLVRRAHTLSVRGEVMGSSLESFGVRTSVRMADGLPPLPSTHVEKYCWFPVIHDSNAHQVF